MRFKLDQNLSDKLTGLFVEAGHDAVTVAEQGMAGDGDADIATVCAAEGRALVTLDTGFADIRFYPPGAIPAWWSFAPAGRGLVIKQKWSRGFCGSCIMVRLCRVSSGLWKTHACESGSDQ